MPLYGLQPKAGKLPSARELDDVSPGISTARSGRAGGDLSHGTGAASANRQELLVRAGLDGATNMRGGRRLERGKQLRSGTGYHQVLPHARHVGLRSVLVPIDVLPRSTDSLPGAIAGTMGL